MAYFAKLNPENIVEQVISVHNNELLDNGIESEAKGIAFCKSLYGQDTNWVQTSYNKRIRKKYASIGDFYDINKDKFISPQPYPSWSLDTNDDWQAPVVCPETYTLNFKTKDNLPIQDPYKWDENSLSWILIDIR